MDLEIYLFYMYSFKVIALCNNQSKLHLTAYLMEELHIYSWGDINLRDLKDIVTFSGFRRLAVKYIRFGLTEMARSLIVPLQVKNIQRFIKEIKTKDVTSGPAGVRAQAMAIDGKYSHDSL